MFHSRDHQDSRENSNSRDDKYAFKISLARGFLYNKIKPALGS